MQQSYIDATDLFCGAGGFTTGAQNCGVEVKMAAMAFRDDYIVLGTQKNKVKQLGNAVTPPVIEWLVGRCLEVLK